MFATSAIELVSNTYPSNFIEKFNFIQAHNIFSYVKFV